MNSEPPDALASCVDQILREVEASPRPVNADEIDRRIAPFAGAERVSLFRLLLSIAIRQSSDASDRPIKPEYSSRFPEFREIVEELFDTAGDPGSTRSYYVTTAPPPGGNDLSISAFDVASEAAWPAAAGRYRILGELARGGMGAVLRAHDAALDRPVALKVMLPGTERSPLAVERFRREASITAQLQHPGVPPLHDMGILENDCSFFAMKLIEGESLAEMLRRRRDSAEDLPRYVAIFESICQAVAYAHRRGYIHRDLKPANVMVGEFGEVQLMDWGLAKRLHDAPDEPEPTGDGREDSSHGDGLTSQGVVVGTPAFMAPEQACGDSTATDRRSDVFGLAGILCVILTGRPPYFGASKAELLAKCCRGAVDEALQALDSCGAPSDLSAIARRGLSPSADRRQADASEMADEVRVYRESAETLLQRARMEQAAHEARRVERRKRRVAWGLLAVAALAIAALVGYGVWSRERERREFAISAKAALNQAVEQLEEARSASGDPRRMGEMLQGIHERHGELQRAAQANGPLDEESATRLRSLSAELAQAETDRRVLELFHASREQATRVDIASGHYMDREATSSLWEGLSRLGLSPSDKAAHEMAAVLRDCHPEVRRRLIAMLQFLLSESPTGESLEWTRHALSILETSQEKKDLLEAIADRDIEKIKAQSRALDVTEYSPEFLFAAARQLTGTNEQLDFLRKARLAWPGDFWLNHLLGNECLAAARDPTRLADEATRNQKIEALRVEAISCLEAAWALEPNNAGNLVNLGIAYSDWGDIETALKHFEKAAALEPNYGAALSMKGVQLMKLGREEEGEAAFEASISRAPEFAPGYAYLGRRRAQQQRFAEAIALFKRETKLAPSAEAYYNLGKAQGALGEIDQALAQWRSALEVDPTHVMANYASGLAYSDRGELKKAIAAFENARREDPANAEILYALGVVHFRSGQLQAARDCLGEAASRGPLSGAGCELLGIVLYQLGDKRGAAANWLKANELGAGSPNTRVYLATELAAQDRLDEAIDACRAALKIDPSFSNAWYTLSELQAFRGEVDEAIASLERVVASDDPRRPSAEAIEQQMTRYRELRDFKAEQASLPIDGPFPTDAARLAELARISAEWRGEFRLATKLHERLFSNATASGKAIEPTRRFVAACQATQAASLVHHDRRIAASDGERGACRSLALAWMRAELGGLKEAYSSAPAESQKNIRDGVALWLNEPRLASVRDAETLANLPPDERSEWEAFWSDVRQWRDEIEGGV